MEVALSQDAAYFDRSRQVSPPDDRATDPPGGPVMMPPSGGPSPRMPGPPTMPGGPPPGGRPGGPPPGGRPGGPPGRGGRGFGGRRGFGGGRTMSSSMEHGTSVQMRGSTPGMPQGGPPPAASPVYVRPKTPEEQASSSEEDSSDDEGAGVAIEQSFVSPEDDSMEEVAMAPQHFSQHNSNAAAAPFEQGGVGQQVGTGGVGGAASDEDTAGDEFQQMQQQWMDERRELKMKVLARDSKLKQAEMQIQELQDAVQLARDRAYAAEADAQAAKDAPPPNEALMSMIDRLQTENRNLRKEMISPSIEDEAEKLMAFSDEMDERTDEIKSLRAELDRVNAENARLVAKARNSGPPHGVAKVTAVKVVAPVQEDPMAEDRLGSPSDAAHAEVMNLRKQCNRLRFQLSEANQKIVKLQENLLSRGGSYDDEDPLSVDAPRKDAWSSFGAARPNPAQHDPFGGAPRVGHPARDHSSDEMDTDSESQSSPMPPGGLQRQVPDGDREKGMVGDPRAENSQRAHFESAGRMAVGTREGEVVEPAAAMFEPCGRNGVEVYMIKRCSIKYTERTKGCLDCYTVTVKATGDFVLLAVRETGLSDVVGSSGPFRMFCEDVKPACYNGISPDGSQPSYMGKLVPKSESRGKEFNLFKCKPHRVGLDKKEQEQLAAEQELQAWIKVKWKSIAKIPEPRRIKVQLHGDNSNSRMLRNFCAEKRTMTTKLAMFDSPVTSRKNFVLMWEQQPGVVGGDADNNIVELAKVAEDGFQLNVKDTLSPFQTIGVALSSITAEK